MRGRATRNEWVNSYIIRFVAPVVPETIEIVQQSETRIALTITGVDLGITISTNPGMGALDGLVVGPGASEMLQLHTESELPAIQSSWFAITPAVPANLYVLECHRALGGGVEEIERQTLNFREFLKRIQQS
jgi:hypothetical protein